MFSLIFFLQAAVSVTCYSVVRLKQALSKNTQSTLEYLKKIHKLPVHKLCGCGNSVLCSGIKPRYAKKRLIPAGPDLPLTSKDTHTHTQAKIAQLVNQSSVLSLRYQDLSFLGCMEVSVFYHFYIWLPLNEFVFSSCT